MWMCSNGPIKSITTSTTYWGCRRGPKWPAWLRPPPNIPLNAEFIGLFWRGKCVETNKSKLWELRSFAQFCISIFDPPHHPVPFIFYASFRLTLLLPYFYFELSILLSHISHVLGIPLLGIAAAVAATVTAAVLAVDGYECDECELWNIQRNFLWANDKGDTTKTSNEQWADGDVENEILSMGWWCVAVGPGMWCVYCVMYVFGI